MAKAVQESQAPAGSVSAPDWGTVQTIDGARVVIATPNSEPNLYVSEQEAAEYLESVKANLGGVDVQKHGIYPGSTPQVADAALTDPKA